MHSPITLQVLIGFYDPLNKDLIYFCSQKVTKKLTNKTGTLWPCTQAISKE